MNLLKKILHKQKGQTLTEFVLIIVFVGLVLSIASSDLFNGIKVNYYQGMLPLSKGAEVPNAPNGTNYNGQKKPPQAIIKGPLNVHVGQQVIYSDQSIDPDGRIVSTSWGTKTVNKQFMEAGTYYLTLTVIDNDGMKNTASITVNVGNDKPAAVITVNPDRVLNVGEAVAVSGSRSTDPEGDQLEAWEWHMTGPDSVRKKMDWPLTGYSFKTNELTPGTYTFELKVMDALQEWSGISTKQVRINRPPTKPSLNTKVVSKNISYAVIEFQAFGSTDPDGDEVTYDWSGLSADNKYYNGTHTIKVRAKDSHGAFSDWVEYTFSAESPMKTMFEKWTNYIRTGSASGEWKYDATNDYIYSTKNVGWTGYWNPEDVSLKDYTLTWDMRVYGDSDNDNLGMTFRMQDTKNGYFLAVDQGGESHVRKSGLYKMVNGQETLLVNFYPDWKWTLGAWESVKIEVKGNTIKVWRGTTLMTTYTDNNSPFLTGAYGPFTDSQAGGYYRKVVLDILP